MEDHRSPAGRNGSTQASFTNQVPASWGSPSSFFLLCLQVRTPLVRKSPTATPVLVPPHLQGSGPAVDGILEIPAPSATLSFPWRCSGVLQVPSSRHKSKQRSHSLRSCSRPGHKGTGTPAGFSWWRGCGSRQRPCKGNRSQGKRRRSKKEGRVGYCSSGQELPGHLKGEPAVVSPFWGFRGPRTGTAWTSLRTGTHGHAEK